TYYRCDKAGWPTVPIPADETAQKTGHNRTSNTDQDRDYDATWIAARHQELCHNTNQQSDQNHPQHNLLILSCRRARKVFVVDLSTDAISEFETCHQSYVRMCFCLDQCCAIQHTYPDYCHKFESKKAIVCSPWGSMGTMFSYTQVHR